VLYDTAIVIVDTSEPVVGIVDTYVTIPPQYIVAVKNMRRRKYREYRDAKTKLMNAHLSSLALHDL